MNNLINLSRAIPTPEAGLAVSYSPVVLNVPGRDQPLELRVTLPAAGNDLPVVLLSHGHGPSLYIPSKDGYGPLVDFLAERGFAVLQPTHANSKVAGLSSDHPNAPLFWRERVEELRMVLDGLAAIEAMLPGVAGRLDHDRVAAIGHSLGGHTVGLLMGARPTGIDIEMRDPRVKVGVLLAAPGEGGNALSEVVAKNYPAIGMDFSGMATRTFVVAGDSDESAHLTVRGPAWHADPFHRGPGADALLTLIGGKHGLGGISGYDAKEADDEDPDRLELTRRMTWAYLRSALVDGDPAWARACEGLARSAGALGRVEAK